MIEKEFTIKNKTGLHARPASRFVKLASTFESEILLSKEDESNHADNTADGKSIMNLLSFGAGMGTKIKIKVEGSDEEKAMNELVQLLESFDD